MKRTIYLAIITLITIVCVLCGVNGWFHGNLFGYTFNGEEPNYSNEESTTLEAFHSVVVDAAVMDITIKQGQDYFLDYKGTEQLKMSYRLEKGTLSISQRSKRNLTGINSASLVITVPMDTKLKNTDIEVDVGDVNMKDVDVEKLEAESDVGNLDVANASFENVTLDSDTGDIKVTNCSFINLEADSDVGDIDISSSMDISHYTLDLKTDVGEVEVGATEHGRKYYQSGKDGSIRAHGDVGDISINES